MNNISGNGACGYEVAKYFLRGILVLAAVIAAGLALFKGARNRA